MDMSSHFLPPAAPEAASGPRRRAFLKTPLVGLVLGIGLPGVELSALANDTTNFKALIAATSDSGERIALARRLAMQRLARGVVPALDACFDALALGARSAPRVADIARA